MLATKYTETLILWWHHQSFLLKQRFTLSYYFDIWELSIWKVNFILMDTGGQVTLWSEEVKWSEVTQSCPNFCNPLDYSLPGSSIHGIFQAKSTGMGCHFLLQGIFPTQGSNEGLPHCRQTLYHLSYRGREVTLCIALKSPTTVHPYFWRYVLQ